MVRRPSTNPSRQNPNGRTVRPRLAAITYRVAMVADGFDVREPVCLLHPVRRVGQVVHLQLLHGCLFVGERGKGDLLRYDLLLKKTILRYRPAPTH